MPKLPGAKVRNGAPRSVAKGRCVMTNEATLAILYSLLSPFFRINSNRYPIKDWDFIINPFFKFLLIYSFKALTY